MTAPEVVACARCLATYPENDEAVTYAAGDWWCTQEPECDDRLAGLLEAVDAI
jgi:hypothetical protein